MNLETIVESSSGQRLGNRVVVTHVLVTQQTIPDKVSVSSLRKRVKIENEGGETWAELDYEGFRANIRLLEFEDCADPKAAAIDHCVQEVAEELAELSVKVKGKRKLLGSMLPPGERRA